MNLLVIGSGGREHALCWTLKKSPAVSALYAIPGNAGIAQVAEIAAIDINDHDAIITFCHSHNIEFVVVGPEGPLVDGLVDRLGTEGIKAFGPSAKAARLEASKGFTKDICSRYNIPTAKAGSFIDAEKAKEYIATMNTPIVVKADGLAGGKGVIIAESKEEAIAAAEEMLSGKFGTAGTSVLVEEFLEGEEVSFFALADGNQALYFGSAQDHKRVGDGDTGLNTGGMGTYSPAPIMTDALVNTVMESIIAPTVAAMKEMGTPFRGMLFAGLMITKDGPQLLEYNTRFGDPETQSLLPRLKSDLLPLLKATAEDGILTQLKPEWQDKAALCVVMAAEGYPEAYKKNTVIRALDKAASVPDVTIFHAGTRQEEGKILAIGGRVLGVTATGKDIAEAQQNAYQSVDIIDWPEGFCRRDIGWRAVGIKG